MSTANAKHAGNRRKLTRAEKKEIAALIRAAKGDGKAHTAQQTIPYLAMYPDGICKVTEKKYSKSIAYDDINYQLAQADDKTAIFENWCDFLNYFDASVNVQLSFINQGSQQEQAAPEEPEAAPEPQQSAPSEAPPGFWPELVKRLKTTLPLPEQAMFSTQDNAPVRGTLHGDVLELQTETEFVRNLINKPEVLRPVSDAATALLGRPVRVRIASGKAEKPNEGFERLVSFGQEHPELVDLK